MIRRVWRRRAHVVTAGPALPVVTNIIISPTFGLTTTTSVAHSYTATGTITSQSWVFKINGTQVGSSTLAAPTFTYPSAGTARAELQVTGPGGTSIVYGEDLGTVTASSVTDLIDTLPAGVQIGNEFSTRTWDPPAWRRLEWAGVENFGAYGTAGGTPIALDSAGYPVSGGWSKKVMENAGRGSGPVVKLGAWKIRATPRTPGSPGTWSLDIGVGATLTNYAYDAGQNLVTADLNISSTEAVISISCTQAVTALTILEPGASSASTQILSDEAIAYLKQFSTFRTFNFQDLNDGAGNSATSWASWPSPAKFIGKKGWGASVEVFKEIHNAANSRCKFLSINLPPFWNESDLTPWAQYLKDNLPATAGLLVGGTNETWNSIYPTLHLLVAQVNGYSTSAQGDAVTQISRADRIRVAGVGKGNAWRAVTSGSHAAGATVINVAPSGEGSIVAGDAIRFQGFGTNYTIVSGLAETSTGGTITISPALQATLPSGSGIEVNIYDDMARLWALREARVWKAFRNVFGADWGTRVYGMCHTHFVNPYWHRDLYLPFLNQAAQVAEFGAINTYIHGIGGAPYPSLSYTTYSATTSAADIVNKLRTSTFPEDITLDVISAKLDEWNAIKTTYGIRIHYCYEAGFEHQGYIPDPNLGGFYVSPYIIDAIRSADFLTYCNDMMAILRAKGVRIVEWLHAMPTSYVALPGTAAANSHWGIDAQIAANQAAVWNLDTGVKAQALKAHMLVTGQLPLV